MKTLPKITGTETGWRRSFAIYRSLVNLEQGEGYDNLRRNDYRSTIASIDNIVSHHDCIFDAYTQCELIENYTESDVDVLRMARILAQHGITDIAGWDGNFASISGIGSKYARILEAARKRAKVIQAEQQCPPLVEYEPVLAKINIRIQVYLRDQLQKEAAENGISMSQLIRDIIFKYVTEKKK
jgi:predicted HicB family RNase H-like nuclease